MHRLENFLSLNLDANRHLVSLARQPFAQLVEGNGGAGQVDHHDHREEFPDHRLADVEDIDVGLGEHVRNPGNDADAIGSYDGNDRAPPAR